MGLIVKDVVSVTTDASGDATSYSSVLNGRVVSVRYIKNNFDNGVDFTITNETTGQGIWTQSDVNASDHVYPLQQADDLLGATLSLSPSYKQVHLAEERVKVVVAQGGNAKTGAFHIYVER